mmetsp:Transcript_76392/g.205545  ORF Transcript_76392/g.205545 Transcript_76392/m.205545 type:complete len:93 (+) Transcript_76392:12695-12973(+)
MFRSAALLRAGSPPSNHNTAPNNSPAAHYSSTACGQNCPALAIFVHSDDFLQVEQCHVRVSISNSVCEIEELDLPKVRLEKTEDGDKLESSW